MNQTSSTFKDTKNHYEILDGLRGVAALMVVAFHILEPFSGGNHARQLINHGYLAVDFFFMLSGFVIGYAYDDRWTTMSIGDFFKRRLIRLHPMIIVGMILGAIMFYFQASDAFPMISNASVGWMLLIMLIGFTLIPVPPSMDIRGWAEMHPLNGPAWSLFFEYVANILYAAFIRKFSNTALAILVFISGCALIHLTITSPHGDVIGGWALDGTQLRIGFTRLLYPFFAGLLLSRLTTPSRVKNSFFWCCVLLITIFAMPRLGTEESPWMNGLFESLSIVFIFPLIVFLGASGQVHGRFSKINKFLGDISYPIYIVHFPFVYTFTAWVSNNKISLTESSMVSMSVLVAVAVGIMTLSVGVAYGCLKLYDEPVRRWMTKRFLPSKKEAAT